MSVHGGPGRQKPQGWSRPVKAVVVGAVLIIAGYVLQTVTVQVLGLGPVGSIVYFVLSVALLAGYVMVIVGGVIVLVRVIRGR